MKPATEAERQRALYRPEWLSPKKVGERIGGVTEYQVTRWIEDGELQAMEVQRKTAKKKRYKVRKDWAEEFLQQRMARGSLTAA